MKRRPPDRPDADGEWLLSRRGVLQGMGGAAATAALACGSDETMSQATTSAGVGGSPGEGGTGGSAGNSDTGNGGGGGQGAGGSAPPVSCDDNGGLSPEELLAPIDTIVVLCMENRSFDHYLGGSLGLVEGRSDIAGLTGNETNPAPGGGDVSVFPMSNTTPEDPPHQWDAVHEQWNNGQNDGFVKVHAGGSQDEVMGYYVRDQLPVHHALADAHVVCNHYYCSVLGGTWPNRFYLHGATANGMQVNAPLANFESIWPKLQNAGISALNYHHGVAWCMGAYFKLTSGLADYQAFKQAAQDGTLPRFSIIDPQFFGAAANDDHPSNGDIPLAQLLISDVYTALANSPQWDRCLFVVTYDEHGGFYDHVPPPAVVDDKSEFAQMGFRVPTLVAGPYVRKGCAVNTVFDHVSVLSTLATRFGIADLNQRMAASNDLSSCIDPSLVKNETPRVAVPMPQLSISRSALRNRVIRHPQHPELVEVLKQQGIYRQLMRKTDPHRVLSQSLEDCVRKGIARLVP